MRNSKFGLLLFTVLLLFNCKKRVQKIVEEPNQVVLLEGESNMAGAGNKLEKYSHEPFTILNMFPDHGFTDPHTIIDNGRLFLFGGHDESWNTVDTWRMDRWEIWSTSNLKDWKHESNIFPKDTYIGNYSNCWAGDIIKKDDKYYWYFSNKNIDTGVMVSDSPTGPFKDVLGKPLLPKDIIKGHPYDPEVYEENGVYTMFFSAGTYYAVTLADDMISLADKPQPIVVKTKDGKKKFTNDKSTVFKKGDNYYLVWGSNYAMSKHLRGPYIYQGKFLKGGHNNVFQWNGQWYVIMENKDISLFYRGVSLKPLYFNEDGTIKIPKGDKEYPHDGRTWTFSHSEMGWKTVKGPHLEWNKNGSIKGKVSKNTTIESSMWLLTNLTNYHTLEIKLKNQSEATQARVSIASYDIEKGKRFWLDNKIYWEKEQSVFIDIVPNSNEFLSYTIDLSKVENLKTFLKQLRIEPAVREKKGSWEIEYISIK
ncbi:family 43 glycosylhydrolase [Polaribacter sp. Z022]|uniref:family 43 glycosylhydrolase n=1 Tax=Polaribacter sp. Z022 TaxID=2927125 RepID=UPI0020220C54|nr:family 43 glycosylhydrolase [Polaribacter sp. Z022]MCL7754591.1 family 43 glycosylhydrolase [Polaribacter sp. Z022]